MAIIAFRGTRKDSRSDWATDVAHFTGADTPYYRWAQDTTSRILAMHRGWQIVTTGHSLGGSLALDAALHLNGVRGVAFNPAGMPEQAWSGASQQDQKRMIKDSVAYVGVTPIAMDPVSAGSIVGLSVIPATIFAIPVADSGNPVIRHSIDAMIAGLNAPSGDTCDYDVGALGLPASAN